jgi:hypothetical protein
MQLDVHTGIHVAKTLSRRIELRPAYVPGAVQKLALKVRDIDGVEIDKPDLPHSGSREVQSHG